MLSPITITVVGVFIFVSLLLYMGIAPIPVPSFDRTEVTVRTPSGAKRTTITARLARSRRQHYVGLSRTETLPDDEGMLFLFGRETTRTIAMRAMDYPLDIIFVDADGRVTAVETADPPAGLRGYFLQERRSGRCTAVLEVNAGWADKHSVEEGDVIEW